MNFFKNKKVLIILGLIILFGLIGLTFWGYQWLFKPLISPGGKYDVVLNDARFRILAIDTLRATTSLEFILPIERRGERVTSLVWCGSDEMAVIQSGSMSQENRALLNQDLTDLGTKASFEDNLTLWEKYGAEVSRTDGSGFVRFIAAELRENKTPEIVAKCQDNTCSVLKKDCRLFAQ